MANSKLLKLIKVATKWDWKSVLSLILAKAGTRWDQFYVRWQCIPGHCWNSIGVIHDGDAQCTDEAWKWEIFDQYLASPPTSQERYNIEAQLLQKPKRKLYVIYRMAPFSMTLSDRFVYLISDVVPCWNKIILGRSTDGGGSGLKLFKIILF